MRFTSNTILAASLLSLSAVAQAGTAYVYNTCDYDVYLWSVSADNSSSCHTLEAGNGTYSEHMYTPSVGGVSLKMAKVDDLSSKPAITQLEYTLNDMLWYDTSNVDCTTTECPFQKDGMYMESGDGCPTMSCEGGALTCHGAYTAYNDDWATLSCDTSADLALYLCTDSKPSSSSEKKRSEHVHRRHPHWRF